MCSISGLDVSSTIGFEVCVSGCPCQGLSALHVDGVRFNMMNLRFCLKFVHRIQSAHHSVICLEFGGLGFGSNTELPSQELTQWSECCP